MLVKFDEISDQSRLWLYASETRLTTAQNTYIIEKISKFLQTWEAHRASLKASVKILEKHFIIVALDESSASATGCSIDSLQKVIQNIEQDLSISILNRLNVFCRIEDKVVCIPSSELSSHVSSDTLFYDLTIIKKHDLSLFLKPPARSTNSLPSE